MYSTLLCVLIYLHISCKSKSKHTFDFKTCMLLSVSTNTWWHIQPPKYATAEFCLILCGMQTLNLNGWEIWKELSGFCDIRLQIVQPASQCLKAKLYAAFFFQQSFCLTDIYDIIMKDTAHAKIMKIISLAKLFCKNMQSERWALNYFNENADCYGIFSKPGCKMQTAATCWQHFI